METQSNSTVVGEAQPNPLFDLLNSYAALRLALPLPPLIFFVVAVGVVYLLANLQGT